MRRSRSSSMLSSFHASGSSVSATSRLSISSGNGVESGAPANCVDGLETAGRHEPGARIGGHTIARPLLQSRPESVVQRLLGDIEVAEQAD